MVSYVTTIEEESEASSSKLTPGLVLKAIATIAVPSIYVWVAVLNPFLRNGMPTGWDTGAYLAWANSLRIAGFGYVQSPSFFRFAGLNLVPELLLFGTISVSSSLLAGYVLFQVIVLSVFFSSTFVLSWKLRNSFSYTILAIAILVTSYAFIRMTRDLYANLLCMAFLQFALTFVIVLRNGPNKLLSLGLFVATGLMFFTDVEVGGFGAIVLLGSLLLSARRRNLLRDSKGVLMPIVASVLVASILWSVFAIGYLSVSTLLISPFGSADWETILLELGGYLLVPLWGVVLFQIFQQLRRGPRRIDLAILGGWSAAFLLTCIILLAFRPSLAFRVALLLPTYFLLAESVHLAWRLSRVAKKMTGFIRPLSLLILICVGVVVTVSSASTFVTQTSSDLTDPFFTRDRYETLTQVSAFLQSNGMTSSNTIFLIYPQDRISHPQVVSAWTNLYDNWIFATVGPHITYYGTLGNLTFHIPMGFVSSDEEDTFRYYTNLFATQVLSPSLNLVVVSFLYTGNELGFSGRSSPVPGVYVYHWNATNQSTSGWMPSYLALSQTGGYFKPENWSLSGYVLESYQPTPSNSTNNFQAAFSLYSLFRTDYSIDIRMYDFDPSSSPILASIDGTDLFAFNYYGSLTPRVFSAEVGNLTKGYHVLVFHTLIAVPHNLDLDAIRLSVASGTTTNSPVHFPLGWAIVDGAGTISNRFGATNSTVVSGSPDLGGILGTSVTFPVPFDLSQSQFVVFRFNSSVPGTISIWLNDSNGNTIRYDSRYSSPNRSLLVIIPILPYNYGFASPSLPIFSEIDSVELGIMTLGQAPLTFNFTNPVSLVNPIPLRYL